MKDISPTQDSPTSAADGGRSRLHTKIQELVNVLMVLSGLAALKHQKSALFIKIKAHISYRMQNQIADSPVHH